MTAADNHWLCPKCWRPWHQCQCLTVYRSGWAACMQWADREPPSGDTAMREAWLAGWDDAMDAPLGSRPELL